MRIAATVLLLAAVVCACTSQTQNNETPPANTTPPPAPAWRAELLAIAAEYRIYTKMADDPHWAPTMCKAPTFGSAFVSKADEGTDHGRKLYFLWVKDAPTYPAVGWFDEGAQSGKAAIQPVGQALVKESFHPGEGANPADPAAPRTLGAKAGLFVMFKTDAKTPGTDQGWVYGTLSADGKQVTSAGRIDSCMGCHENARHDRLFGMPAGSGRAAKSASD